jgi:hypothetical protein
MLVGATWPLCHPCAGLRVMMMMTLEEAPLSLSRLLLLLLLLPPPPRCLLQPVLLPALPPAPLPPQPMFPTEHLQQPPLQRPFAPPRSLLRKVRLGPVRCCCCWRCCWLPVWPLTTTSGMPLNQVWLPLHRLPTWAT